MDSTYAGSAAKARILKGELLSDEDIERILDAKTPTDIIALMDGTPYQEHLKALSTFYSGYDLLELASTRRMITFVLKIVESPPAGGLEPIRSYISRWDIDSIKSIITSKFLGKKVEKEDLFIVDAGRFPIGMTSNLITKEDYSLMINENDVEGITKYLTKLGYGVYMLRFLDEYRKEKDISILLYALISLSMDFIASFIYFSSSVSFTSFILDIFSLDGIFWIASIPIPEDMAFST